ncbi:MAG: glycosyltransferase [Aequorivita sp.]
MKTKLLFIYGPLGGGGAERVLIDILNNLDKSKYDADLCLIVNQGILLSEVPSNITIIPLWKSYNSYYKLAYRLSKWGISDYLFKRVLSKKLKKKYDVEISFLEGMPAKLHGMTKSSGKKISWVHCDLYNFPYEKQLYSKGDDLKTYNSMDRIVCVSKDALGAFSKRFPDCKTPIEVIYNPIDISKILKKSHQEIEVNNKHSLTVITVGRLTLQKRIDRIIRLAKRMKLEQENIHFQIIGDGELKEELLLLRKKLDVEDYVSFKGFVNNPYPYIADADIMLLPSGYEGFGLVVCEAMALGIPVISTKTAGPTEIIDNNRYGLLCNHDDHSIYDAVMKMYRLEQMRQEYSDLGRQRAEDFSVHHTMESLYALINRLVM